MKIALCMKYVPIISRIQFDYEAKTIIREGVPSEVNPFDLLGLVRAVELKNGTEDEFLGFDALREFPVCYEGFYIRNWTFSDRLLHRSLYHIADLGVQADCQRLQ